MKVKHCPVCQDLDEWPATAKFCGLHEPVLIQADSTPEVFKPVRIPAKKKRGKA